MTINNSRRELLRALATLGVGSLAFQRALAQQATRANVSRDMIVEAEWVAGIELNEAQREMAAKALTQAQDRLNALRQTELSVALPPSHVFRPQVAEVPAPTVQATFSDRAVTRPTEEESLARLTVQELAGLLKRREIRSLELTELYLRRLRTFDPLLQCVVTLTEEVALAQAQQADREIAAGHYRGPLHGIPWGVKDLFSFPGHPTTWGAPQYQDREIKEKAAVIEKLERAGAVLVGKLTTGNYAMGDQWFGGKTRNPWNPHQGASGSSAGSASATAASLVGFSLGTETLGSIISPARRCGVTGLRPTFGSVSRYGCMPLAWSLDKIGPICRSAEDCAVVFAAIVGRDKRDPSTIARSFQWPNPEPLRTLRVGYEASQTDALAEELRVLQELGVTPKPLEIPRHRLLGALRIMLTAESSAIFDPLTRAQEPKGVKHWPTTWAMGQFISAVDYLQASRVRREVMEQFETLFAEIDVIVGANLLLETNMTGHPQVVIPNGFRQAEDFRVPKSLVFTGRLLGEAALLSLAAAYQNALGHHRTHPDVATFLARRDEFHAEDDRLDATVLYP